MSQLFPPIGHVIPLSGPLFGFRKGLSLTTNAGNVAYGNKLFNYSSNVKNGVSWRKREFQKAGSRFRTYNLANGLSFNRSFVGSIRAPGEAFIRNTAFHCRPGPGPTDREQTDAGDTMGHPILDSTD